MRVKMKHNITGFRNGEPWPAVGECVDLPDGEAADMIANGYAEEATHEPTSDDGSSSAGDNATPTRRRGRKQKAAPQAPATPAEPAAEPGAGEPATTSATDAALTSAPDEPAAKKPARKPAAKKPARKPAAKKAAAPKG